VTKKRSNLLALALVPTAGLVAVGLISLRMHFQPPTVPSFAVANAVEQVELAPGQRFSLEVRPSQTVQGAIAARGFLIRGDEVRAWNPPFAVAVDGTVRVEGPVEGLFADVPPGAWEVAVAIGRPENLPTAPRDVMRAVHAAQDQPDLSWRLVRERVFLRT
jgi:hypothetical protein